MPLYFDKQDHELLHLVNRTLERDRIRDKEQVMFSTELHPHGVKELAASRALRIAHAVINLLDLLEAGQATDRISALYALRDEVLYSATSEYRHNTARVLIQIMKDLVRAWGDPQRQLRLAHDFRAAASGKRRVVRAMLKRYYLLEMPESWDQLTFDNHVHDANTKGRKTPTHLIMDAWIKGIRSLTVIYYNYVEPLAVEELLQAAGIMDINVRIGIEFMSCFRGRYVEFIWEPVGLEEAKAMRQFLQEEQMQRLMEDGRAASAYRSQHVFSMLDRYNSAHRFEIGAMFSLSLPKITKQEFLSFVAAGQPSLLHLAELIYFKHMLPAMQDVLPALREQYAAAPPEEKQEIEALADKIRELYPERIMETWFTTEQNPMLPDPGIPPQDENVPPLLRLSPKELVDRLSATRALSRISLTLSGLGTEDVLELLYDCAGKVTHLELFNLKDYVAGTMSHIPDINELQVAINQGSAVALKRLIRGIKNNFVNSMAPDAEERRERFREILQNIAKLQRYYRRNPLKTRVGSDSTSRSFRLFGMGFAFIDTLPGTAQKSIRDPKDSMRQIIPLRAELASRLVFSAKRQQQPFWKPAWLMRFIRKIPGFQYAGYDKQHDWLVRSATTRFTREYGNIATMGGFQRSPEAVALRPKLEEREKTGTFYMNTHVANTLKVLAGLTLASSTFLHTQNWWLLAWFGGFIWLVITGLRNILQAVLGGGGIRRTPLLRWNDYVSWSRLCDSLLYTGISVPLLEWLLRLILLHKIFGLTSISHPVIFFTIISTANGLYISSHNIYRGLPKEAVVGNLFRSVLAIPVAIAYNSALLFLVTTMGIESGPALLVQGAAVVTKTASDTVAGVIEGFGDQANNMRLRFSDYNNKLKRLFSCFARLEVLLPEEDVAEMLHSPRGLANANGATEAAELAELEKAVIIHSLDLMYFWMRQPRARTMLASLLRRMSGEERAILMRSQLVLSREREVSQLFVDGIVWQNFAAPLAFYLNCRNEYLRDMDILLRQTPADRATRLPGNIYIEHETQKNSSRVV